MSIINQTLRELDARKAGSVPLQTPPRPVAAPFRRRLGLWVTAAILLPAAGLLAWFMSRPAEVSPQPQAVPAPHVMSSAPIVPPVELPPAELQPAPPPEQKPPVEAAAADLAQPKASVQVPDVRATVKPKPARMAMPMGPSLTMAFSTDVEKPPAVSKEINRLTAEEDADDRYRRAVALAQKGRDSQARTLLDEAVRLSPGHIAARQILATMLSEAGQNQEAETLLREGRAIQPDNAWFALNLARLQAARGEIEGAAATMLSGVGGQGVNADYHATLAALLVRLKRHPEAARQYELALRLQADQGVWWMGLGLARATQGKTDEARAAYRRALATGNLPDNLVAFVNTKLAE